jgi:hypothetical protein
MNNFIEIQSNNIKKIGIIIVIGIQLLFKLIIIMLIKNL